jgi:hypothetical protein
VPRLDRTSRAAPSLYTDSQPQAADLFFFFFFFFLSRYSNDQDVCFKTVVTRLISYSSGFIANYKQRSSAGIGNESRYSCRKPCYHSKELFRKQMTEYKTVNIGVEIFLWSNCCSEVYKLFTNHVPLGKPLKAGGLTKSVASTSINYVSPS